MSYIYLSLSRINKRFTTLFQTFVPVTHPQTGELQIRLKLIQPFSLITQFGGYQSQFLIERGRSPPTSVGVESPFSPGSPLGGGPCPLGSCRGWVFISVMILITGSFFFRSISLSECVQGVESSVIERFVST
ncbi:hypothetical protein TNCV_1263401 [Trichonephila clavipes]|nr:hypothetical protein TNCV_1263401 [Trichonephila clavipes]